jgi:hypothetical protein
MEYRPPALIPNDDRMVFLAGSIEMGTAEPWQDDIAAWFLARGWTVLNPRRANWDPSWAQSIDNPQFVEQVEWELDGQDAASLIFIYLSPGTKSPISLLELGLGAAYSTMVVCCPDEFWRKGNVDIVCRRYNIPCFATLEEALEYCEQTY